MKYLIIFILSFVAFSSIIYLMAGAYLTTAHEDVHKAILESNYCQDITIQYGFLWQSGSTSALNCSSGDWGRDYHAYNEVITYNIQVLLIPLSVICGMIITIGILYFVNNFQNNLNQQEVKQNGNT